MVPTLVPGIQDSLHALFQCCSGPQRQMHYTCIERCMYNAMMHPLVYHARIHPKANDKSKFDWNTGRVLKGHQSDFDLELILAASGATMYVGLTAHNVDKSLLALWWKPGKRMDRVQLELAECIFYDIVEADHIIPKRFKAQLEEERRKKRV